MSMRTCFVLAAAAVVAALPRADAGAAVRFQVYEIGVWGDGLGPTAVVDVDRDGDMDFIAGQRRSLSWWEYQGPGQWVRHEMYSGPVGNVGGVATDVDGDGWVDFVATKAWYRNPGRPREKPFERVESGVVGGHDIWLGDVDGDGKRDVVSLGEGGLYWYKIPKQPREKWAQTRIGEGLHAGLAIGDVDGDGDNDVVRADRWYENADGKGTRWTAHKIPFDLDGHDGTKSRLADLDGDGDLDLAVAHHNGGRVSWMENADGKGRSWKEHNLAAGKKRVHSLWPADLDGDGDLDLYAGETLGNAYVWENVGDKKRPRFVERVVAKNVVGHQTRIGDVDGDGDPDLCGKTWQGPQRGRHVYLRNMQVESARRQRVGLRAAPAKP